MPEPRAVDLLDAISAAAAEQVRIAQNGNGHGGPDNESIQFFARIGLLCTATARLLTPPEQHPVVELSLPPARPGPRLEGQTGTPVYMTEPSGPRWAFTVYGMPVEACLEGERMWVRTANRPGRAFTKWATVERSTDG